ncbi:MAG: glycogen debranching protein GlgX [Colwellia sp.]|nr:glycogen debranching protein GlgX [Colwellia sp.]
MTLAAKNNTKLTLRKNGKYEIQSGRSYPLGATVQEHGINFALFSANAEKVELCLFDGSGKIELQRITLLEFTDDIWHGFIEDLPVGTLYGYRVHGPFAPHEGHRFNAHKLLLDPYAKQFFGKFVSSSTHYAFDQHSNQQDLTIDIRDNAAYLPKCVVIKPLERCDSYPQVRRRDTIIYELHVKGFTQQHPDVPIELRGTFAGLAQSNICQYLQDLGITSVELMPIHTFINEAFVKDKELSNYWGYNSLAFFVPDARYCHSGEISEFKHLVETFHKAGIEVLLDVVYNHTAEGNELGPTLSFKGIDNASYYRLKTHDKRYYVNDSGCGNTINISHPRVLQLITDSLRYWVEVMGVDGFRFDLAPILGRVSQSGINVENISDKTKAHFNANSHFFSVLKQDPILAKVKLIAEPWDIGESGYQLGRFPNDWLEWNDRFRDTCRRFWRGEQGMAPDFAARLHGSSDIFEQPSRRPSASINFITSHDGFTLNDLVSYETQKNHANGEDNEDGHHSNFSGNYGVEGATDNDIINKLRQQQKRNLLTTLFIAQGTPMLLSGDEFGNSQQGNNNAYCQDNEISWLNWEKALNSADTKSVASGEKEISFVKKLISLRKEHPLLNRTYYQHGKTISVKTNLPDISWFNCRGQLMQENDWHDGSIKCFSMLLAATRNEETNSNNLKNSEYHDDALLIIFNAHQSDIEYTLPAIDGYWQCLLDTANHFTNRSTNKNSKNITTSTVDVYAHSCLVLSFYQNFKIHQDQEAHQSELRKNRIK